jgi:hypothetical protein
MVANKFLILALLVVCATGCMGMDACQAGDINNYISMGEQIAGSVVMSIFDPPALIGVIVPAFGIVNQASGANGPSTCDLMSKLNNISSQLSDISYQMQSNYQNTITTIIQ